MNGEYQRPFAAAGGLRLHLNENTAGCSPRVLEAIRSLDAEAMAFYPEYDAVERECAAYLGVDAAQLLLTNGLDEGIFVAAVAQLQARGEPGPLEAIVPLPAFDMYAISSAACGGCVVTVDPRPDFRLPVDAIRAAVTPRTRLVWLTSPNNPTGVRVRPDEIVALARALPDGLVFVDEAYVEFGNESFVPLLRHHANVVVGRTFAKAHGMAALRAGCVVGDPETLAPLRRAVPPYSLNVCAAAGLRAALADRERLEWYIREVEESRRLVYELCDRAGLEYWESGANFVLLRVGGRAAGLVEALAAAGVFVRDKSSDAGCEGCVRITTGVVAHTKQALALMEEFLCGAA